MMDALVFALGVLTWVLIGCIILLTLFACDYLGKRTAHILAQTENEKRLH